MKPTQKADATPVFSRDVILAMNPLDREIAALLEEKGYIKIVDVATQVTG